MHVVLILGFGRSNGGICSKDDRNWGLVRTLTVVVLLVGLDVVMKSIECEFLSFTGNHWPLYISLSKVEL